MALRVGRVPQDQKNIDSGGGAAGAWKANISKGPKNGGPGGRTPLGDLSNSIKPYVNRAPKKPNSVYFTENENPAAVDASKKKGQDGAGRRKALSDISNSGKLRLKETPKNFNAKLSVLTEEPNDLDMISQECFVHNHQECIKANAGAGSMNQFLNTIGLHHDVSKELEIPRAKPGTNVVKPQNIQLHLEELEEEQLLYWNNKKTLSSGNDDSLPASPIVSPKRNVLQLDDLDDINFKLTESP